MKRDNIFLTETRRDVLAGESDLEGKSLANEKSRIRTRSRAAVEELIEVARSEEIANADVFEPEVIGTLLYWILNDPSEMGVPGGLIVTDADEVDAPDDAVNEIPESLQEYRQRVVGEVSPSVMSVRNPNRGRFND
jgi:hypothetical protein